jgi:putative methyltransferase (TIGR04325 family)
MRSKAFLKSIVPPMLWSVGRDLKRRLLRPDDEYAYAPDGWDTPLPRGVRNEDYWNAFIAYDRAACEALMARVTRGEPPLIGAEYEWKHVTFAYALALSADAKDSITVLDYGGSLGDYFWHAKALLPRINLEYHCKELPAIAEVGRQINPAVIWHTDDSCLRRVHDLVMFSSSLEYVNNWQHVLRDAADSARRCLFLSDVPTVRNVPAFVATERRGPVTNLHWQLNGNEVVDTVEAAGLRLLREFAMGPYPRIANAPEQPTSVGWLFRRESSL